MWTHNLQFLNKRKLRKAKVVSVLFNSNYKNCIYLLAHIMQIKKGTRNLTLKIISNRHFRDAYSLLIRKNGGCCGVMDNGCIYYGLNASVSG